MARMSGSWKCIDRGGRVGMFVWSSCGLNMCAVEYVELKGVFLGLWNTEKRVIVERMDSK